MNPANILIEDYDYPLPDELIARHPLAQRDSCKLLVRDSSGVLSDKIFSDIVTILPENTMLVCNNTRVINARLRFRKGENHDGAQIEVFCLEPVSPADYALNFASQGPVTWACFVGNSKRWKDEPLKLSVMLEGKEVTLTARRKSKSGNTSIVEFSWDNSDVTFSSIISSAGEIPIPPYLNRATEETDRADYQTVYSHVEGSVAAPTAGLHFTDELFERLKAAGTLYREVTLHVGAGTFQPVKSDKIGDHDMHSEFIIVDRSMIKEIAESDRKIIAVGTTSVRTLESLYHLGCMAYQGDPSSELKQWYPYSESHPALSVKDSMEALLKKLDDENTDKLVATTRLMIAPGYEYKVVDGIITNFHQPRSTLLLLVSALIGESWRDAYNHALKSDYRFLSYGDACFFMKNVIKT